MSIVPGTVAYFNSNGMQVLVSFPMQPNKNYTVQITADAISYADLFSFTAPPQMPNYSWSVNPTIGPWPRMIEN